VTSEPRAPSAAAVERLNQLAERDARRELERCCGASRWVEAMLGSRPFASPAALLSRADAIWQGLEARDFLEAFSHHPEIGADLGELRRRFAGTAALSESEQAGAAAADEATLRALAAQNRAYRERYGYTFIVCATGKSAGEMLNILEQRLGGAPDAELALAAAEQAKITILRLEKICST
jgi:2-oxo-4-hydroxy-4-carboxy-5-ureidoimidazoline decarboxylase